MYTESHLGSNGEKLISRVQCAQLALSRHVYLLNNFRGECARINNGRWTVALGSKLGLDSC